MSAQPNIKEQKPLSNGEVLELRKIYGYNEIETARKKSWPKILLLALLHPFNILLCILATASGAMEDFRTMAIMITMVALSSIIRFDQEWKSHRAAQDLLSMVSKKVWVIRQRDGGKEGETEEIEINTIDLVPGDWVVLEPGNIIPADLRIVNSKDLHISQAALTGEAIPVEKYVIQQENVSNVDPKGLFSITIPSQENCTMKDMRRNRKKCRCECLKFIRKIFGLQTGLDTDPESEARKQEIKANLDRPEMLYMGTSVLTGVATAIVRSTGTNSYFGMMADAMKSRRPENAFQMGVRRISWIFFITMACMVPPVLLLQGFLNTNWTDASLFALSVAVGLTPEMLPMIVNTTLAKGAFQLAQKKCIVKSLDAVVNLGGMDILCTDKTGTLTQSVVTLKNYANPFGMNSTLPLHLAYLNSFFQSANKNPMDIAVLLFYDSFYFQGNRSVHLDISIPNVAAKFEKIEEIPFDFERRRTTVILKETPSQQTNKNEYLTIMICKGAVEEMLPVCTLIVPDYITKNKTDDDNSLDLMFPDNKNIGTLTPEMRDKLKSYSDEQSEEGLRMLAIAYKIIPGSILPSFDVTSENNLVFVGFLAFLDPPKESTSPAIKQLLLNNVSVKVLTGDSTNVCKRICQDVGLPVENIVTSKDLLGLNDKQISDLAERTTIFSKLTPIQKADIIKALRRKGHIVGFLGDGINDSPALIEADVGISVDSATDIAKESADIILLEKDLGVVVDGVIYGRATYGNTLKYIVMAVSSNFGNVFSMLVASSWLKFVPMLPIHVVVQNLLYDISQISIPWDHMDREFLIVPHRWSMKSVLLFMIWMGPWSSVYDITTFAYMYFYYGIKTTNDDVTLFQTTWFTEGLLTQTLIVHMIRTPKIPFLQSRAALPTTLMTILVMGVGIAIPFIPPFRKWLRMTQLDNMVYPYIVGALISYAITAQLAKMLYICIFKQWF